MTTENETPICISCGMPMRAPNEHAAGDASKPYCLYCCDEAGELKSYDAALAGMTGFITRTQGLDEQAAREAARQLMAKMPAWSAHRA